MNPQLAELINKLAEEWLFVITIVVVVIIFSLETLWGVYWRNRQKPNSLYLLSALNFITAFLLACLFTFIGRLMQPIYVQTARIFYLLAVGLVFICCRDQIAIYKTRRQLAEKEEDKDGSTEKNDTHDPLK